MGEREPWRGARLARVVMAWGHLMTRMMGSRENLISGSDQSFGACEEMAG